MAAKPYVWQMIKEAMNNIGDKASYSDIKKYIHSKYGEVNDSTITCQIIVCTVNHATRIHYPENKKPRVSDTKYDFLYTTGRGQVERYNPEKHGIWEIKEDETGKLIVAEKNDVKYDVNLETKEVSVKKETEEYYFPLESHLRDFIAQNIDTIKVNGKSLKLYVDENGTDGIEFRTDVGIIDILALDEEDNFIIFELKLSRGNDATLGQILRYMGWVKANIAGDKEVHGVIVAKSIDDKLKYAVTQVKNITLFEYEINFNINLISLS
ncbi:DUF91 domain-containing protein [Clostridium sporogenes]|uniref:endonuclease NucS domain-containing protein n=1 Tax=Clostridium sporogenes TaxID=1509 RepID=UPI0013D7DD8D|nr:endonuclease NucS domain-containing protein [Clostridium sporogenes]NFH30722.1 DUF91 domain-containing protein [Clostridium sporogenes]NFL18303.1 DUF91 domain-containing protein [Clostridium sporogenes]NFN72977.1 DUF91 domain-containing protein [Clostridium sporogenes]NFV22846.1 DUF91 domain-containing protein [Clostridium sporogenes]